MNQSDNDFSSQSWIPKEGDPLYFHIINEIKDYAIFFINTEGKIVTWNKGCIKIKQWGAEEAIGKHYRFLFRDEDQKAQRPEKELEIATKEGRFEELFWRKRKDGSLFWANVILTAMYQDSKIIGFAKITRDLTERKKNDDELYRKNELLLKAQTELDNFIYSSGINLKGPIANLEGLFIKLKHQLPENEFNQIRELLIKTVSKLKSTLQSIMEVSKVNLGIKEAIPETINLNDLFNEIRQDFSLEWNELCPAIDTDFIISEIYFSKVNLKIIIYNLVTNAIKFRSPHRPCLIKVSSERSGDFIIISVKDNGVGMREGYKEKLFRMFRRLHDQIEGAGVGLYLVKRIVDHTGGKLDVESKENEGTEFKVYLKQFEEKN